MINVKQAEEALQNVENTTSYYILENFINEVKKQGSRDCSTGVCYLLMKQEVDESRIMC
jgi:vacuolar-type H+-ATPase subunit E/Vma4